MGLEGPNHYSSVEKPEQLEEDRRKDIQAFAEQAGLSVNTLYSLKLEGKDKIKGTTDDDEQIEVIRGEDSYEGSIGTEPLDSRAAESLWLHLHAALHSREFLDSEAMQRAQDFAQLDTLKRTLPEDVAKRLLGESPTKS